MAGQSIGNPMTDERRIEIRYRNEDVFKQMLEALRTIASDDFDRDDLDRDDPDQVVVHTIGAQIKSHLVFIRLRFQGHGSAVRVTSYGAFNSSRHRLLDAFVAHFGPMFAVAVRGVGPYEKECGEIVYLKPHARGSRTAHDVLGAMTAIRTALSKVLPDTEIDCLLQA